MQGVGARSRVGAGILALGLLLASSAGALEYDNGGSYLAARHDRFVLGTFPAAPIPNAGFFLASYGDALSGMGWDKTGPGKKIALISPRHFLNADHYQAWSRVSFLDPSGTLRTFDIESNEAVTGDLAVGTLTEAIPEEYGITHFSIAPVAGSEWNGREVVYVANAPESERFAAGRTGLAFPLTSTGKFDSSLVAPERSTDRVFGITGDSGGPSFIEEDGELLLLGHHYSSYYDQLIGLPTARALVDDYLAADGYLLDVHGEGRVGDSQAGELVVTGLTPDGRLDFDGESGGEIVRTIRLHDFSYTGADAVVSVSGDGLSLRVPGSGSLLGELALDTPADGSGASLEVVFETAAAATAEGLLTVDAGSTQHVIPVGDAPAPLEPAPATFRADPIIRFGMSGSGGAPGELRTFPVIVINNDPAGQPDSEFVLSASCPIAMGLGGCTPGWSVSFEQQSVVLSPGETAVVNVDVVPPSDMPPVLFVFPMAADRPAAPAFSAGAAFLYLVTGTLEEPPEEPTPPDPPTSLEVVSAAGGSSPHVTVGWTAPATPGVVGYEVERDGSVVANPAETQYRDTDIHRNQTYTYVVRSVDSEGLVSADSASLSVRNGKVVSP